jgi:hypothetical protein
MMNISRTKIKSRGENQIVKKGKIAGGIPRKRAVRKGEKVKRGNGWKG